MKYLPIANSIILLGFVTFFSIQANISKIEKANSSTPNHTTVLSEELKKADNVMSVSDFGATKYDEFESDQLEPSGTEPKIKITRVLDRYCGEADCEEKTSQAYEFGLEKANATCEIVYSELMCCLNGEVVIALIKIYPSVYCGETATASAGIKIR